MSKIEFYNGVERAKKFDYTVWNDILPSGNVEFEAKMIAGVVNQEADLSLYNSNTNATGQAQDFGTIFSSIQDRNSFGKALIDWKSREKILLTNYGTTRFPIQPRRQPSFYNYLFSKKKK